MRGNVGALLTIEWNLIMISWIPGSGLKALNLQLKLPGLIQSRGHAVSMLISFPSLFDLFFLLDYKGFLEIFLE